jgi:hypothetical protein
MGRGAAFRNRPSKDALALEGADALNVRHVRRVTGFLRGNLRWRIGTALEWLRTSITAITLLHCRKQHHDSRNNRGRGYQFNQGETTLHFLSERHDFLLSHFLESSSYANRECVEGNAWGTPGNYGAA